MQAISISTGLVFNTSTAGHKRNAFAVYARFRALRIMPVLSLQTFPMKFNCKL